MSLQKLQKLIAFTLEIVLARLGAAKQKSLTMPTTNVESSTKTSPSPAKAPANTDSECAIFWDNFLVQLQKMIESHVEHKFENFGHSVNHKRCCSAGCHEMTLNIHCDAWVMSPKGGVILTEMTTTGPKVCAEFTHDFGNAMDVIQWNLSRGNASWECSTEAGACTSHCWHSVITRNGHCWCWHGHQMWHKRSSGLKLQHKV